MAKKIKYIGNEPVNKYSLPSFSTFNDSYSTTIFNGGIQLSTKFSIPKAVNRDKKLVITQKNVTLSDLKINNLTELNDYIKVVNKLKLNTDKTNLSTYAVYGSLKEKFRVTINNIINKFPGALHINDFVSGVTYFNVLDYTYDNTIDISSFRIPINVIENPFFINLFSNASLTSRDLINFPIRYEDYVIEYNNINYSIKEFTGFSSGNSAYLYFSVFGDPFGIFSASTVSDRFLIKPNDIEYNKFYDSLTELERYFLNKNTTPKYSFEFKIPEVNEDDELEFVKYTLTFPVRYDGYNLDTESISYVDFLDKIFEIGDLYDDYKSNLILRKFTPSSLIDFDGTDSFKSESFLKIYGNQIDEIKMFFDSLMYMNNTSYDKINNIPDTIIKNLARTLSWKAQNIISDKDLVKTIFSTDKTNDTDVSASLAEIDIELWRRLVINTAWFLKSKGTRGSIETIFSFIGAPESLINVTEHVYVVDAPIGKTFSITEAENASKLIARPAYDEYGFPAAPSPNDLEFFQINGNEDFGQAYIDIFRREGFNVRRVIDNKKSWVYTESAETYSSFGRNTFYSANDSRLIINTKEIDVNIDIARAIEYDVYQFNVQYNYPVIDTGSTVPYPQRESNKFHASGLTFAQYIDRVYSSFINAQNRKVSDSAIGSYYPSLTKLYYDYLESPLSNKRRYRQLLDFVYNIDAIFTVFVKQFVPATAIYDGGGLKIRNTEFTPQKYVYKQGIDDGSEFEGKVSEEELMNQAIIIIETEIYDTNEESLNVATISTQIDTSNNGNIDTDIVSFVSDKKNVQPTWDGLVCESQVPNFNITGATKIELSSFTNNSIYNKSEATGHTVSFNFTSSTETLSASTTEFYFNLHKYNHDILVDGFDDAPIYTFSSSSTAFTSSTEISTIISDGLLSCDSEYIIKPYFIYNTCSQEGQLFTATTPYTMYENFVYVDYMQNYQNSPRYFDYTKFSLSTGSSVTTLVDRNSYNPSFRNYNNLSDYYFISLCEAEKPLFNFPLFNETEGLIVETIPVNETGFTKFNLSFEPVGDIIVAVNGVTILEGLEYSADTSITIPSIQVRSFVLLEPLSSDYADVLTVAYYKNSANNQRLIKENFLYNTSPSISYNGTNYIIDLTYPRVNSQFGSQAIVYLNGIMLDYGSDYTFSVFDSNKVVLNSSINLLVDDSISVVYFVYNSSSNQIITLTSNTTYDMLWSTANQIPSNVTGNFTHQFYDIGNSGLTGTSLYSLITPYTYNVYGYSQIFTWSSTPLVSGLTYFYRIKSEKYFTTINNVTFTSTTYSDTIRIKLPI